MSGGVEFDSVELQLRALMGDLPSLPQEPPPMVGRVVGDTYEVLRELGEGGMGQVFVARHRRTGGEVAIKVIRPRHVSEEDFIARFEREARNTAALNHPNIVKVFDYGVDDRLAYIAMELAAGQSVGQLLEEQHVLSPSDAIPIAVHTLHALKAAHDAGLVHRDIKPDNILVAREKDSWFVKVLDFGIAHAFEAERAGPQSIIGSPHSMAPEQFQPDADIGPAADLYALGCTMFAMLTGYPPFHGTFWELAVYHAEQPPPPLDDVPEPLADWVYWLLAKSPTARPESAQAALDALLQVERGQAGAPVAGPSLPTVPTTFVGREGELAAMTELVRRDVRLLTLTGIGGLGKTRLSLEWGHRNARLFTSTCFCDLAETRTAEELCSVVAQALGAVLGDGDPAALIGRILSGRGRTLVLLDNFEQIAEHAAATVGVWQEAAPDVTFVVTSRHRLNLHGEHVVEVSPLPTAEPEGEGVQLFVDRAKQARADFELDDEGREVVRTLVEQLDGLPLAIEMAAARVRSMSPGNILERLGERFRLLRSSRRDISDRQMTMRAALDWSWDLLDPAEQAALAQLAVFAGSFDLEAAEAVLDLPESDDRWVVDVLESLVDKSLVRRIGGRFSMFVSVHDYAREKLHEAPTEAPTRARHLAHFAKHMVGPHSGPDIENLHAAIRFGVEHAPGMELVSVTLALARFANAAGPIGPTIAIVERVLEVWSEDSLTTGFLYQSSSSLRGRSGDYEGAIADGEAAAAIGRRLGEQALTAQATLRLMEVHEVDGHFTESERLLPVAIALADECKHDRITFMLRLGLSRIRRRQGRFDEARDTLETMLEVARQSAAGFDEGLVRLELALLHIGEGNADAMLAQARRSLAIVMDSGGPIHQASAYFALGRAFQHLGDYTAASAHLDAAQKLALECTEPRMTSATLLNRAAVAVLMGHPSSSALAAEAVQAGGRHRLLAIRATLLQAQATASDDLDAALALVESVADRAEGEPGVMSRLVRMTRVMLLANVAPTAALADELAAVLGSIDGLGAPHWLGVEPAQLAVGCHIERARIFLALGQLEAALEASSAARTTLPFEQMSAAWQLRDLCVRVELLAAHGRGADARTLCRQIEQMRERFGLYPQARLSQIADRALGVVEHT